MAKNKDYTCDRCGAQFDTETGYSLRLCPKESSRIMFQPGKKKAIDFDLCESCASAIADELRDMVRHHATEKEVSA